MLERWADQKDAKAAAAAGASFDPEPPVKSPLCRRLFSDQS